MSKVSDIVARFWDLMSNEIVANSRRKGDRAASTTSDEAWLEVERHMDKLHLAIRHNDPRGKREHAADVANCLALWLNSEGIMHGVDERDDVQTTTTRGVCSGYGDYDGS